MTDRRAEAELHRQLADLWERYAGTRDESGRAALGREIATLRDRLSDLYAAGRGWR